MIIDANTTPLTNIVKSDVCIIGAGAAGISIAKELSDTNLQVILLESGSHKFDRVTQSLYAGKNVGLDYFPLVTTRLRYFGGSSNHWGGMCAPLDAFDFQKRDWIELSGWPLKLSELHSFYERAHALCKLGPYNYDPAYWEGIINATRLPLESRYFETGIIQYSPPTRFGRKYRVDLEKAKNVTVIMNANVLELISKDSVNSISTVQVSTLGHREFNVQAKVYVLACGGIENARILLLSNRNQKKGLGNAQGLVGRFFTEHPHWDCGIVVPQNPKTDMLLYNSKRLRRKPGIRASAFLRPSEKLLRQEHLPNAMITLRPIYEKEEDNLARQGASFLDYIGRLIQKKGVIEHKTYRSYFEQSKRVEIFKVGVASEQIPNHNSQVRLAQNKDHFGKNRIELDWKLREYDSSSVIRMLEIFAREIGKAEFGRFKLDFELRPGWPGGNHHMGTTRMHSDSKFGVVDSSCRVHDIDNLYIAGSSIFPTAGAVNPTLTIVALALRLADHLKKTIT